MRESRIRSASCIFVESNFSAGTCNYQDSVHCRDYRVIKLHQMKSRSGLKISNPSGNSDRWLSPPRILSKILRAEVAA
ncbi:hypothetical protein Leryth_022166 [Lithospermum erythrorhizon]|nr:hypothetical protein Leryth_022166 [Lithospermum erythrorhizon]